jgi:hypothetical protein
MARHRCTAELLARSRTCPGLIAQFERIDIRKSGAKSSYWLRLWPSALLLGGSSLTLRLCANIPFDEAGATCHTHREQGLVERSDSWFAGG